MLDSHCDDCNDFSIFFFFFGKMKSFQRVLLLVGDTKCCIALHPMVNEHCLLRIQWWEGCLFTLPQRMFVHWRVFVKCKLIHLNNDFLCLNFQLVYKNSLWIGFILYFSVRLRISKSIYSNVSHFTYSPFSIRNLWSHHHRCQHSKTFFIALLYFDFDSSLEYKTSDKNVFTLHLRHK